MPTLHSLSPLNHPVILWDPHNYNLHLRGLFKAPTHICLIIYTSSFVIGIWPSAIVGADQAVFIRLLSHIGCWSLKSTWQALEKRRLIWSGGEQENLNPDAGTCVTVVASGLTGVLQKPGFPTRVLNKHTWPWVRDVEEHLCAGDTAQLQAQLLPDANAQAVDDNSLCKLQNEVWLLQPIFQIPPKNLSYLWCTNHNGRHGENGILGNVVQTATVAHCSISTMRQERRNRWTVTVRRGLGKGHVIIHHAIQSPHCRVGRGYRGHWVFSLISQMGKSSQSLGDWFSWRHWVRPAGERWKAPSSPSLFSFVEMVWGYQWII